MVSSEFPYRIFVCLSPRKKIPNEIETWMKSSHIQLINGVGWMTTLKSIVAIVTEQKESFAIGLNTSLLYFLELTHRFCEKFWQVVIIVRIMAPDITLMSMWLIAILLISLTPEPDNTSGVVDGSFSFRCICDDDLCLALSRVTSKSIGNDGNPIFFY